jgi:nitrate reductase alpha subunit
VPVQRISLGKAAPSAKVLVATVFDLQVAQYGVDRGLGRTGGASFDDDTPYTPAWQEKITGVPREQVITVARQFADNADKTQGQVDGHHRRGDEPLVPQRHELPRRHQHADDVRLHRQSGGGWAHYVGQEKLRPQTGWTALAFALDWIRPPRQQNSTSFFYAHTDQWRYEKLGVDEVLSPLADKAKFGGSMIDYNVRAERMGWLPVAPQLRPTRCRWCATRRRPAWTRRTTRSAAQGRLAEDELHRPGRAGELAAQHVRLALQPAGLVSGKGHEYFLKHLLGTSHGVQGKDLGRDDAKPTEVSSGTTRRPRASSTCWSRWTSA